MKENRREFLKKSATTMTMLGLATQARHFGMINAMAQTAKKDASELQDQSAPPTDYRAIVCILLSGGNDGNNLIIPNHSDANISNYAAYAAARSSQGLAIPQNQLLPISVPRLGNLTYGLNPNLGAASGQGGINNGIHELWGQGKMAIVANTGNLVRPLTKTQFLANPAWRPFQLFSHSDQVQQQQTSRSDSPSPIGWGGKIADRTNAANNPNGQISMITSIAGTQLFTLGQTTTPLAIRDSGTALNETLTLTSRTCCGTDAFATARNTALAEIRTIDLDSALVGTASHITDQAQIASTALSTYQEVSVAFPDTNLGKQLKQVARVIKKRNDLSINRQVFFVELSGFDTHQNQIGGQNALLLQVSQAMRSFYDEMGAQNIQNNVTAFTLSDFGRTMNPAGSGSGVGSDHAWGNHMLVVGGSVMGGNIYGNTRPDGTGNILPTLQLGGSDDTDTGSAPRGRWLPTTSVEQYAATIARWYGLSDTDLSSVFPNIGNFPINNLGFMLP
jgi:uncharacterized protein (DUF1501 family)